MSECDTFAFQRDPIGFIDTFITVNEKGRPWTLSAHQRRVLEQAFQWDESGQLGFRILLWGEMKKSGKTFLAACLILWWAFVTDHTEIVVAANDLEQAQSRVFRTTLHLVKHNAALTPSCTCRASDVLLSNGTIITAIASDYKGAAGARHSLVTFDEPWGYTSEAAQRLFEELTPPPTEPNAWVLMTSVAGWIGESILLEPLYQRGLAGERIDADLELYRADDLVMFWSETPRQPWQNERYYSEQRRLLRPGTYARLHENQWVSAESTFLHADLFDPCVEPTHTPLLPTTTKRLYVGVDAGIKHDSCAVVGVYQEANHITLAVHRIWYPTKETPLDLEATVEAYLQDMQKHYLVERMVCDPYQLHRSIMTLKAGGLPIEEFPQSVPNCTRMGQVLFDLFTGRNLVLYPAPDLRQQALNTVAVEHARGWRIAKEKSSKKIDAVVALAMACVAALDHPVPDGPVCWGGAEEPADEPAFIRRQEHENEHLRKMACSVRGWFPGD